MESSQWVCVGSVNMVGHNVLLFTGAVTMGVLPPASSISWLSSTLDPEASGDTELPTGTSIPALPAGGYMGEGLLPIPEKTVKKILELAFVEMRDLMPETWPREEEESSGLRNVLILPKKRAAPVTDIGTWVQCFAGYVSVLSSKFPKAVPELMAYMATIVKCSKHFEGVAWAQYDRAFRKQMAQLKNLKWSRLNPTLFSLCFAGKAKANAVCAYCLSDNHRSEACPENPSCQRQWGWQEPVLPSRNLGAVSRGRPARVCYLYNRRAGSECTFNPCKYLHVCSACKGNHPRSECQPPSTSGELSGSRPKRARPL